MKLTLSQAEARLTAAWGKQAHVVGYYLYGNRTTYAATDHGDHWMPLATSWVRGQQVFEPVGMEWPSHDNGAWTKAVTDAAELARQHFIQQRNVDALKRLPRAQVIAEARNWVREDDDHDTWLIPSSSYPAAVYEVDLRCTCPDYTGGGASGGWCKHRLARALGRKAEQLLQERNGTGSGAITPAPGKALRESPTQAYSTTPLSDGQPQRIELVVGYEASEHDTLAFVNADGLLIEFRVDGQVAEPPAGSVPQLYRWLQVNGYSPNDFKWLGWERGLRQRLQRYIKEVGSERSASSLA